MREIIKFCNKTRIFFFRSQTLTECWDISMYVMLAFGRARRRWREGEKWNFLRKFTIEQYQKRKRIFSFPFIFMLFLLFHISSSEEEEECERIVRLWPELLIYARATCCVSECDLLAEWFSIGNSTTAP